MKHRVGYIPDNSKDHHGGQDRGQKNHGGYKSRGDRIINPSVWKDKAKELPYHQIHIKETFPRLSKLLQEENLHVEEESILLGLFEENSINVIITKTEDTYALE